MHRTLCCAVLVMMFACGAMAGTQTPPFDYFVSLYKWQTTTTDSGSTDKVFFYLGNNALQNGAPVGPGYRVQFTVVDPAGHTICSEVWQELGGIPTGKTYAPYSFQVVYPKLVVGRLPAVTVQYRITAAVYAEHPDGDQNLSNQSATNSFSFKSGGKPSCTRLPRPQFH